MQDRIKRPMPARQGPVRHVTMAFRGGADAADADGAPKGPVDHAVSLAYKVFEEYIRQGREAAARARPRHHHEEPMRYDQPDVTAFAVRFYADMARMYLRMLNPMLMMNMAGGGRGWEAGYRDHCPECRCDAHGQHGHHGHHGHHGQHGQHGHGGHHEHAGRPDGHDHGQGRPDANDDPWRRPEQVTVRSMFPPHGAAAPEAEARRTPDAPSRGGSSDLKVTVDIRSRQRARVSLQLHHRAPGLGVLPLHGTRGGAAHLAGVSLTLSGNEALVTLEVPDDLPAGKYVGSVIDGATGAPCGNLTVDVGQAG